MERIGFFIIAEYDLARGFEESLRQFSQTPQAECTLALSLDHHPWQAATRLTQTLDTPSLASTGFQEPHSRDDIPSY